MSLLQTPVHPGEVLKELYLELLNVSSIELARRLRVPRTRIERLVKGTTSLTPDTALRLARVFNTTSAYWINMQTNFDMSLAAQTIDIAEIEPLVTVA
ncbi:HigA family addiction module antitoxin [bacterium]|nr:HigA family addiction module antitoxin [bacterium]